MALLAIILGVTLWQQFDFTGQWLNYKVTLVGCLLVYHITMGNILRSTINGTKIVSTTLLKIYNESVLLIVVPIIYLVVSKAY